MFMPISIFGLWFRGIFSILLLGGGTFLLGWWYQHRETQVLERIEVAAPPGSTAKNRQGEAQFVERLRTRTERWQFGVNKETAWLLGGVLLLGWSVGGGWMLNPRLLRRRGKDEPTTLKGETHTLHRPDGTELHVECFGPPDAPPMVCVHGWGLDHQEWYYFKKHFAADHRLITWDLPGLGKSTRPPDRDWSLEKLAHHLDAVIVMAGDQPVVLVGHSIGAMIVLTYCKLFHANLGSRVSRLVLTQSTYTNPVKTTSRAWLYTALQKPVLEPLCHLMIWLSPPRACFELVELLEWLCPSVHRERVVRRDRVARSTRLHHELFRDSTAGRNRPWHARNVQIRRHGNAGPHPDPHVGRSRGSGQLLSASIPSAELVVLSPARHCGLFEQHDQFHAAVRSFLEKTELTEAGTMRTQRNTGTI